MSEACGVQTGGGPLSAMQVQGQLWAEAPPSRPPWTSAVSRRSSPMWGDKGEGASGQRPRGDAEEARCQDQSLKCHQEILKTPWREVMAAGRPALPRGAASPLHAASGDQGAVGPQSGGHLL